MGCRFDGDGMLHAVRIKGGKAAYSNAYVQTSKYKQEKKAGRPLFFTVTSQSCEDHHFWPAFTDALPAATLLLIAGLTHHILYPMTGQEALSESSTQN